jgi:magnesium chelatase family protein
MLVAAMNPAETLTANPEVAVRTALKQERKMSRAIVDRIDMWTEVPRLSQEEFHNENKIETSEIVRARITAARDFNVLKRTSLDVSKGAHEVLVQAAGKLSLSPRAYHRTLRVSRTIAALRLSTTIEPHDVLEALQYRPRGLFGFQ